MKKITLLFSFILGLTSMNVDAQVTTPGVPKTATVSLKINLHPIQTIIVDPNQSVVNVNFTTSENYSNGVTVDQADHLRIYSTGAFQVTVKADDTTISNGVDQTTINSNTIKVLASQGTSTSTETAVTGDTFAEVGLSGTDQPLITSTTGGINRKFNVAYKAMGNNNAYINKHVNGDEVTTYSTTVTYSIITQ